MEILLEYYWFGLWVVATLGFLMGAIEEETVAGAVLVTAISLLGSVLIFGIPSAQWITHDPGWIALGALGYLLVGGAWSVVKWYSHVKEDRENVVLRHTEWARRRESLGMGTDVQDFLDSVDNPYRVSANKGLITLWIVWWVPSMVYTVTHRIIRSACQAVYDLVYGVLNRITVRLISGKIK